MLCSIMLTLSDVLGGFRMKYVTLNVDKELAKKLPSSTKNKRGLIYRVTPIMKDMQISHAKNDQSY